MLGISSNSAVKKFSAFMDGVRRAHTRRWTIEALHALDDHTLKDIGVTRVGIPPAAREGSRH